MASVLLVGRHHFEFLMRATIVLHEAMQCHFMNKTCLFQRRASQRPGQVTWLAIIAICIILLTGLKMWSGDCDPLCLWLMHGSDHLREILTGRSLVTKLSALWLQIWPVIYLSLEIHYDARRTIAVNTPLFWNCYWINTQLSSLECEMKKDSRIVVNQKMKDDGTQSHNAVHTTKQVQIVQWNGKT